MDKIRWITRRPILATSVAIPTYILYNGFIEKLIVLSLVLGIIYTVFRKKIVDWAPEKFL